MIAHRPLLLSILWVPLLLVACSKRDTPVDVLSQDDSLTTSTIIQEVANCDSSEFADYFRVENGRTLLLAGEADSQYFDVTGWHADPCHLGFGFCREHFPAVIHPRYRSVEKVSFRYNDHDRFILVMGERVKAYPIKAMVKYEAVNDTINGHPILVAYCVLADLPIVYSREYCGETLTFGLSGYTYREPALYDGVDAFVLWDRETESLWWPFREKAIAGPLQNTQLEVYLQSRWRVTDWKEVRTAYQDALVLNADIHEEPPRNWPRLPLTTENCK